MPCRSGCRARHQGRYRGCTLDPDQKCERASPPGPCPRKRLSLPVIHARPTSAQPMLGFLDAPPSTRLNSEPSHGDRSVRIP